MNLFEKLGKTIAKVGAKTLGRAVELIPGVSQGKALLGLVKDALGVDSDDPDVLEQAVASNPEAAAKLLQAQMDHEVSIKQLSLEFARVALEEQRVHHDDRVSAREREKEITKQTGHRDLNMLVLSWVVVGGFFLLLGVLIFKPLAPGSEGYINQLFGALTAGFGAVLNYFFGSSKGDSESREMIYRSSPSGGNGKVPAWKSDKPVSQMSIEELRETMRAPDAPDVLKERAKERLREVAP